jgi:hypothetical protein
MGLLCVSGILTSSNDVWLHSIALMLATANSTVIGKQLSLLVGRIKRTECLAAQTKAKDCRTANEKFAVVKLIWADVFQLDLCPSVGFVCFVCLWYLTPGSSPKTAATASRRA